MIEKVDFDNYILSDGQTVSVVCNYTDCIVEVKLQIRKRVGKGIIPCVVCLRFENVTEFHVKEDFGTSGNYSDIVLVNQSGNRNQFYASFDPFGNSGEPDELDNFVIKAAECKIEECK